MKVIDSDSNGLTILEGLLKTPFGMPMKISKFFIILTFFSSSFTFSQTVTDIDGNVYNTVVIGDQEWMQKNLAVTKYNNGDPIPLIVDNASWYAATAGAYTYYNNDITNYNTYGALYNGHVVMDPRGVCPAGWHIPIDNEWRSMLKTICTTGDCDSIWAPDNTTSGNQGTDEGGKIKETGTAHWNSPNTGATNSSGFTSLPAGYRYWDGDYYTLNIYTLYWTATEHAISVNMWFYAPYHDQTAIYHGYGDKLNGHSLRCVRPASGSGLDEIDSDELLIYPNPAQNKFSLDIKNENLNRLKIYDLAGNLVMETELGLGTNEVLIENLVAGVYILEISGGENFLRKKLVVE